MNIFIDLANLNHNFIFTISTPFFHRYKCTKCNLPISQRIDDHTIYGVTNLNNYYFEMMFSTWENFTCDEIIIKNIIE